MTLERVLTHSKTLIKKVTKPGDITIDCTIGNGHDTLFLSSLVGETGKVYGFDIQTDAINQTTKLLSDHNCDNVTLFQVGHEQVLDYIPINEHKKVSSAIFNLGYLPKGDPSITTKGDTTIQAIESLLKILKINGLIVLVVYSGHDEGKREKEVLIDYLEKLNQKQVQVLLYRFINQRNHAPFIIAIEKVNEIS